MNTNEIVELIMASAMCATIVGIFIRTLTQGKGIGARIIQFTCVSLVIPALIILGIESILKGETIATIIGGMIGYLLSGVNKYDNKSPTDK